MLKKVKVLLSELEDLSLDILFISENLLAVEEAQTNSVNLLPQYAITLPCNSLQVKSKELDELVKKIYKVIREVNK